jgi:ATP-dependent Clp protease adaptor protein ClpS
MSTATPGIGTILEADHVVDHDRPWHVIVRNDDHNTFEGVAAAISRVIPKVDFHRGLELATVIHTTGAAIVWSGALEVAELYHEQLRSLGLTMAPLEQAS